MIFNVGKDVDVEIRNLVRKEDVNFKTLKKYLKKEEKLLPENPPKSHEID